MVTRGDRDYNAEQQIAQKQSESQSFKIKYWESADFCFGIFNVQPILQLRKIPSKSWPKTSDFWVNSILELCCCLQKIVTWKRISPLSL